MGKGGTQIEFAVDGDAVSDFPERTRCPACRRLLVLVRIDKPRRHVRVKVHFTSPPRIVDRAQMRGEIDCPGCGAPAPIDLRIFGGRRGESH